MSWSAFTVLPDCTACGACLLTCPERCIRVADRSHDAPLVVLESWCTGCGECAEVCPAEAIVPLSELGALGPAAAADRTARSVPGVGEATAAFVDPDDRRHR